MEFEGAGKVGSHKNLKKSLEESAGNSVWIKQVPADGEITVRFLQEIDQWFEYREHWGDAVKSYYACSGKDNDCPGCNASDEQAQRRSKRYLVNALDVEAGRVIPLKLPVDLVNRLETRYDRNGTIVDRDYTLMRTGKGLNTTYDVETQAPDKLDIDRYKDQMFDPYEKLVEQWTDAWTKKESVEDSNGEVEEDNDVEDNEAVLTESQIRKMKVAELEELCEKLNIEPDNDWRKADYQEAILALAE